MTPEQKQWLKDHLGIDLDGKVSKNPFSTKRDVAKHYVKFYDKKSSVMTVVGELNTTVYASGVAATITQEVDATEQELKHACNGGASRAKDFDAALNVGLKKLGKSGDSASNALKDTNVFLENRGAILKHIVVISKAPNPQTDKVNEFYGELRRCEGVVRSGSPANGKTESAKLLKQVNLLRIEAEKQSQEKQRYLELKRDADEKLYRLQLLTEPLETATRSDLNEKLEELVGAAEECAGRLSFKEAIDALKDREKEYNNAVKEVDAIQKQIGEDNAASVLFKKRLEEIDIFFLEAAAMPGLTAWMTTKQEQLRDPRTVAGRGQFADAWKVLKDSKWTASSLKKEADSVSKKNTKKAFKNEKVKQAHGVVLEQLAQFSEIATEVELKSVQAELNKGLDVYINLAEASDTPATALEKATTDCVAQLTTLAAKLVERNSAIEEAKKKCEQLTNRIEPELSLLKQLVDKELFALNDLDWQRVKAQLSLKEYEKATLRMEALLSEIKSTHKQYAEDTQAWALKLKNAGPKIEGDLQEIAGCSATEAEAAGLREMWRQAKALAENREPGDALDLAETLESQLSELLQDVENHNAIKGVIDAGDKKLLPLFQSCADELVKLRQAVSDHRNKDNANAEEVTTPLHFEEGLRLLREEWAGSKATATNESDLDVDGLAKRVDAIRKEIGDALNNSDSIESLAGEQLQEEHRTLYLKKVEEAETELESLMNVDSIAAVRHGRTLRTIGNGAAKGYIAAATHVEELIIEIAAASRTANQLVDQLKKLIDRSHQETLNQIATAEKKAKQKPFFGSGNFAAYFERTRALVDDIKRSMLATYNVGALETGEGAFKEVLEAMRQIISDAEQGGDTYKSVEDLIGKLSGDAGLGNADLTESKPSKKAMLEEKFKELRKTIKNVSPRDAMEKLRAFETEVNQAVSEANSAKSKREVFKRNKKAAETKLGSLPKSHEYVGSVKGKLSTLEAKSITENKEEIAIQDLSVLMVEIDLAIDRPEFLAEKDNEVRTKQIETEQKKKQWELQQQAISSLLEEADKALKTKDADKLQSKELKGMRSEAKRLAKTGDYDAAIGQLKLLEEHARKVIENPLGERATSRNNLPKDLARYQNAVRSFNKSISDLSKLLKEEAKDANSTIDQDNAKAAISMLERMTYEFNLKGFDQLIGVLAAKKGDQGAKRSAREDALRLVRAYQGVLDTGPLMIKVLLAPFKINARASFDSVRVALNSLDANIRRCVG